MNSNDLVYDFEKRGSGVDVVGATRGEPLPGRKRSKDQRCEGLLLGRAPSQDQPHRVDAARAILHRLTAPDISINVQAHNDDSAPSNLSHDFRPTEQRSTKAKKVHRVSLIGKLAGRQSKKIG